MAESKTTRTAAKASLQSKAGKTNIVMLPVNMLSPHPQNIRKELGDLTELTASIKANGVYQNLTVVDYGNSGYRVIIGHRRLAAAKLAGLTELPCAVVEMSEQKQLETMLVENLQREGLKLTEEIQGFEQLRLSGAGFKDIAKATGFSERSVRRRLNCAEKIDTQTLIQAEEKAEKAGRQITLDELDKVCKIEDEDERKKLIGSIGTSNFRWECESAARRVKDKKNNEECVKILEGLGIKRIAFEGIYALYDSDHRIYKNVPDILKLNPTTRAEIVGERPETAAYFANPSPSSTYVIICFGKPQTNAVKQGQPASTADKDREKRVREEKERRMCKEKLDTEFEKAYKLRYEYMKKLRYEDVIGYAETVVHFLTEAILEDPSPDYEDVAKIFDIDCEELEYEDFVDELYACIQYQCKKGETRTSALCMTAKLAYVLWEDSPHNLFYNGVYQADSDSIKKLRNLYKYLEDFDYEISDAEEALLDGSSELYADE